MLTRTILIAALFLLVGFASASRLHFSDTTENFIGKKKVIELKPDQPVSELLTANDGRLGGVRVALGAEELWIGESLTLSVSDASCRKVIRERTLRLLGPYRQGAFVGFAFSPIEESLGQTYCVSLNYRSPHAERKDRPTILGISHENGTNRDLQLQLRLTYEEPSPKQSPERLEAAKPDEH